MHIPDFMRRVNRAITNPLIGTLAWLIPPFAVVHHAGRRSGRRYSNPVMAFRYAAGFVIPLTYGRDVDWAQNLLAADGGELVHRGRRFSVGHPRIVSEAEADAFLPAALRPFFRAVNFPGYVLLDLLSDAMHA